MHRLLSPESWPCAGGMPQNKGIPRVNMEKSENMADFWGLENWSKAKAHGACAD
jgi:hypothetical protein